MALKSGNFIVTFLLASLLVSCQGKSDNAVASSRDAGRKLKDVASQISGAQQPLDDNSVVFQGGAWRSGDVGDHEGGARYFATLVQVPVAGVRFQAYDAVSMSAVCCFKIVGAELSEKDLRGVLNISGAAVLDIFNYWNSDGMPSGMHVFELVKEGGLVSHSFLQTQQEVDGWQLMYGGDGGGLLLPEDSEVVAGNLLRVGTKRFWLQSGYEMLGQGAGVMELYTLLPEGGGVERRVEIPYGTDY